MDSFSDCSGGYVIQIDNEQSIMKIIPPFHGDVIVATNDHKSALVLSHLLLVLFIVNVIMSLHLIAFLVLSVISALLLIVKKHSNLKCIELRCCNVHTYGFDRWCFLLPKKT
ncbi:hypothetical protein [Geomicrobium sediminis]|uniref:Peptidase S24/S26A/S26B/S26C domain-containing protein n=1 Tax=Geomicrobium sediminis TaxID=1347788 RepID=A0ABS2PCF6_9BACL|nr:hypothetical protein [Geomicrobium sediminis]MBM7633108.1 hypothetical protein [Geomicrobium sediminis]